MTSTAYRVADQLRRLALDMDAGDRLPSIRQLMATFGVSQLSIQKALDQLKDEGLIISAVGRGTFVGSNLQSSVEPRNILVFTREQQSDSNNEVARRLHRALLKRGWRTAVLTYSDFAQAMDLIKNAQGFDACVVHPRQETFPVGLLAAMRLRSRAVIVEGFTVDGIDTDGVAIDWNAAVAIGLRHLIDLGHRRIGLITFDQPVRAFLAVASQFRLLLRWAGLESSTDPVILVPRVGDGDVYTRLAASLNAQTDLLGAPPFSAILIHFGVYNGKPLLDAIKKVAPNLSVATLGFTDLQLEHVDRFTTIGCSAATLTEEVAATIEKRLTNPGEPYVCRYLAPELVVRTSTREHKSVS